jgi:hypothetical protein
MTIFDLTEDDLEWVILKDGKTWTDQISSEERVLELIPYYEDLYVGSFTYRRMTIEDYPENSIMRERFKK